MRFYATIIVLLAAACSPIRPAWPLACDLVPTDTGASRITGCAVRDASGAISVRQGAVAPERFGPEGVGAIRIEGRLYFVNRKGKTAPAFFFDNGADYFVEGLARTVRHGKVGFVNVDLSEVVPAQWDFAYPFDRGFTKVCIGCVSKRVGDEHSVTAGGKWGCIDRTGRVVVPVVYDQDAVAAPSTNRR